MNPKAQPIPQAPNSQSSILASTLAGDGDPEPDPEPDSAAEKARLRRQARALRLELQEAEPEFCRLLADQASTLQIEPGTQIGAYAALPGEADPQLLLTRLQRLGCPVGFPRITGPKDALTFHHCLPGQVMRPGQFGIAEPLPDWPEMQPRLLLVPLLAFDRTGHRLGYGGGYYDRTLAALRQSGPLRAIGIAYAGQEVPELVLDSWDQKLDGILTQQGLRLFAQDH